ncbi:site-specific integrase [Pseudomonas syringae]|uniref:site-specific integrase n=1 Tax=Pseudomonas syringae TaxID=317 RepID=UPI00117A1B5B|nr:site-specific integrase [Pseudomonas syringae]
MKQYAVWLTPFVRFCYRHRIPLLSFSDENLNSLVESLEGETSSSGKVKQNNTVNLTIDSILSFMAWVQSSGSPFNHRDLIGLAESAPNIEITYGRGSDGRAALKHNSHLVKSTPLYSKVAMPRSTITQIEDQIFTECYQGDDTSSVARVTISSVRMLAFLNYLHERRVFALWMFKKTGLRPEELCTMRLSKNAKVLETLLLYLPTRKRRTDGPALRTFKISLDGALTVQHYIDARAVFLESLGSARSEIYVDSMLLTEQGAALSAGSLTKDFSRVIQRAGLDDVRACLSMLRHRFITLEIMLHLKDISRSDRPTRGMINDAVVKSIEERIRKKTGHKLGKSIWHYFDVAFDMMKFWGSVDKTVAEVNRLDDIEDKAKRLRVKVRKDIERAPWVEEEFAALRAEIATLRAQLGVAN